MEDIKIDEIANALRADILNLCYAIGLQGKIDHNEFVAYNPTRADKHLGSFRVCIRGAKQGIWAEFASGERGDPLDLINYCIFYNSTNKHEAIEWAKQFLGVASGHRGELEKVKQRAEEQKEKAEEEQKRENELFRRRAQKIYLDANSYIKGTPAELYFNARGIDFSVLKRYPKAIRFEKNCYYERDKRTGETIYMPAIVAAVNNEAGEFVAVHRTYLENINGIWHRKNKKVLGAFAGSAIHLWRGKTRLPVSKLAEAKDLDEIDRTLIICEGIEDGLSIAMACPEYRIWTALSVSNMKNVHIPKPIDTVIIAGDNDGEEHIATIYAEQAAQAFQQQGLTVLIARPENAHDFNDELTGKDYKHS